MLYTANVPLPISSSFVSDRHTFFRPPRKLILFAWLIEAVAVSVSASLAAYPLISAEAAVIEKWMSAAPFLVIAFAELAKIPIVEAMFRLKGIVLPCIAAFAALFICLNTFYTVSNGFERAHATKTEDIETVKREIASIDRELDPTINERARSKQRGSP